MIICDTHCDTLYMRALQPQKTPCVTMEAMKKGGMSLQTCTLYAGNAGMAGHPYDKAMAEYRAFEHLRDTEGWTRVDSPLEAEDGKVKILLSVEGGEIFEGKVERVREFYGYGVRMAALTWNNENEIGHSAKSGSKEGIKPVGWEILRAMAELKMAADTSHLNEAGFWDLIDKHSQPPMASHSCATALCSHFRNLTDEQFAEIANRRGLVGVNLYTPFLVRQSDSVIDDAIDHIERFIGMYGEKVVALGCDFDGCDTLPIGIDGLADMYRLADRMLTLGYKQETVDGLFYDNAFNFMQKML